MLRGMIFNIQRFSVHDGPGIRTNVFFKGCPLRCAWCHNPEGWTARPEVSFLQNRCVGCGACAAVCPRGVHEVTEDAHLLHRKRCTACGKCADACAFGALEMQGRLYTVEEITGIAGRDRLFYGENGGVTLTGGEPMLQADFAVALAKRLREEKIGVCVETSGYGDREAYQAILPYIDRFLFDIKETDEAEHVRWTGVGMEIIRGNLRWLDENGAVTVLRCPIIPGVNLREEHFREICALAGSLRHVCEIDLEPYHAMGLGKAVRLGKEVPYQRKEALEREELADWQRKMSEWTHVPVVLQ